MCKLSFLLLTLFSLTFSQHLPDSNYTFTVIKTAMGPITTGQFDPIADSLYDYPHTVITYKFEFKENFDSLIIYGSNPYSQTDTLRCINSPELAGFFPEDTPSMNYAISSGSFASGVVHILYMILPIQVDIRIFGSGVPIIGSDVGTMRNETAITIKPNKINSKTSKSLNSSQQNFYLPNGKELKEFEKKNFIGKKHNNDYLILHKE